MYGLELFFLHGNIIGYGDGATAIVVSAGIRMMFLVCIVGLLGLAERVLFGLAAYNDARAKLNPDAVMWGLLIGFLGLIPGIIYLCIRNSARGYTTCVTCGCAHLAADANCPKCGAQNPVYQQYVNPFAAQQAHRAKVMFVVALVFVGLGILVGVVVGINIVTAFLYSAGSPIYY